jgi:hypothetical protein
VDAAGATLPLLTMLTFGRAGALMHGWLARA